MATTRTVSARLKYITAIMRALALSQSRRDVPFQIDCKTVGFFLKISKEFGKAWRMCLTRANRGRFCMSMRDR